PACRSPARRPSWSPLRHGASETGASRYRGSIVYARYGRKRMLLPCDRQQSYFPSSAPKAPERRPGSLGPLYVGLRDDEVAPGGLHLRVGADVVGPATRCLALGVHLIARHRSIHLDLDDPVDTLPVDGDEIGVIVSPLRPQNGE